MSFFEELKKRKVFRTTAAYAVVAFIIMQIVEIVFPMFEIPDWAGRMVIILLFLGIPITIIFSWIFDVTEKGIVRSQPINTTDTRSTLGKKRTWFAAGGIILGVLLGYFVAGSMGQNDPVENNRSIAVLPFDNMSDSKDDEYFSDGITEDIISELAKINDLFVISRTSVMRYKDTDKSMKEIGKELGVATILEGSVRRIGDRVRIVGQLIETATDKHLWTERYDRNLTDIFEVQDEVAKAIAGALKIELSSEETEKINRVPTKNVEAYEAYLKGKALFYTYEDPKIEKSVDEFKRALDLDPEFALAHAGLSKAYVMMRMRGYVVKSTLSDMLTDKASEHAHKGLKLAPDDPEIQFALGYYYFYGSGELDKADKAYRRAAELNPKHAHAHDEIADLLHQEKGLIEEAMKEYEIALSYDPYLVPSLWNVADLYIKKGQFKKALSHAERSIGIYPNVDNYYLLKAAAHFARKEYKQCENTLKQLSAVSRQNASYFYIYQTPVFKAMVSIAKGDFSSAKTAVINFIKSERNIENIEPYIYHLNGLIQLGEKNYDEAIESFSQLLNWKFVFFRAGVQEPMLRDMARYGIGEAFFHQGKIKMALQEFQNMRKTHSGETNDFLYDEYWPRKHYKIGLCYEKMGDGLKAIEHFEKFLEIWSEADEDIDDIVDAKRRISRLKGKA